MSGPAAVSHRTAGPARSPAGPTVASALRPVREAMLRSAHERAAQVIAQAHAQADDMLARAHAQAADVVVRGGEAGQQQATPLAVAIRNRGRRDAQSIRLRAQLQAYEEFQARVRMAVSALRREPGYASLKERLSETAARLAGPGATLTEDPSGGVIARAPGIVVDCSLARLADAAIAALGPAAATLWAPQDGGRS